MTIDKEKMRKALIGFVLIFGILMSMSFVKAKKVHIWMIGDSTMAWKSPVRAPESGWGEGLKCFAGSLAEVHNHAASGRSTLSFIKEGRWQVVLDSLRKGDFLIIQFGHNDEKPDSTLHTDPFGSFKVNLKRFVAEARSRGVQPILCTSVVRRHFTADGTLIDTHGDYIPAAKEAAFETKTPFVDMTALTADLVKRMGPDYSKALYTFTSGKQDSTHLNERGAKVVAFLFSKNVVDQQLPLAKYLDINQSLLLW